MITPLKLLFKRLSMAQTEFIIHDGIAVKAKYSQTDTQHKKYDKADMS